MGSLMGLYYVTKAQVTIIIYKVIATLPGQCQLVNRQIKLPALYSRVPMQLRDFLMQCVPKGFQSYDEGPTDIYLARLPRAHSPY